MYSKIIQTIVNNDNDIINEWIIHHIVNINIDHIYIYDDKSKIPVINSINNLHEDIKSKVTVIKMEESIDFYDHNDFKNSFLYDVELYYKSENIKKIYFYNHFLKNYKNVSKWCYLCDVDEFIYLNNDINLDDILNKYNNFDIIYIPRLVYGSSFHINQPKGLVINNFKYHSNKYNELGKSFYKMNNIHYISNLNIINNNYKCYKFNYKETPFNLPIHINYYQINSLKRYITKKIKLEIAYINNKINDPNNIFLLMLANNDIYTENNDKFCTIINNILEMDDNDDILLENNLNTIYCSNCLYINDNLTFKISSYSELVKILNSDNIQYAKLEDLFPDDFNLESYRLLNKDLSNFTDSELMNHYILFGKNENRTYLNKGGDSCNNLNTLSLTKNEDSDNESIISDIDNLTLDFDILPKDFDAEMYKKLNNDIKHMTNIDAINHYINFGRKEKRIYKKNKNEYEEEDDYKNKDKNKEHISNTVKPNIKNNGLPSDFDVESYKVLNKDLMHFSNEDAIKHYLIHGINEKRKYKIDKNNKKKRKEKKIKENTENTYNTENTENTYNTENTENTENKKNNFILENGLPSDFDVESYKLLNKDLKYFSNDEAIEHYLIHGINEKRKYKIDKNDKNDKKKKKEKEDTENKKNKNIVILENGLPSDFDVKSYKLLNKDLKYFYDEDAIKHYLVHGINEKRKYKIESDSNNYESDSSNSENSESDSSDDESDSSDSDSDSSDSDSDSSDD